MKSRLSIKLCQKNVLTAKRYDKLGKYSRISYVREGQDASSIACARSKGKQIRSSVGCSLNGANMASKSYTVK